MHLLGKCRTGEEKGQIGDGAVIGSGAVVTKNIPPYAVAVGVPAKVIKYRFPEETIQRLLKTRWWDQPEDVIKSLPMDNVEECLQILEKRMKECESSPARIKQFPL